MKAKEIDKTMLLAFDIIEASAKARSGMPSDDEEDQDLPIWSGLIPISSKRFTPITDDLSLNIPHPNHLKALI
jgi:hypothetical protein